MMKKVHFVGVKGVGMASLALIAKQAGYEVTGSDVSDAFITDKILKENGIEILNDFDPSRVSGVDIVITTGAHGGYENPEVMHAKSLNIPVVSQGEAVGLFMDGKLFVDRKFVGISIAGSHGKTTTTGMIATMLKNAGMDPSYVIGTSQIPSLDGPGHLGKGKYVVVEADEYATEPTHDKKAKLLWQHPEVIVLTNIDFDHPDIYGSLEEIVLVFHMFVSDLPDQGILIACGDDEGVKMLAKNISRDIVTFGFSPTNTYQITHVKTDEARTFFTISRMGMDLGEFSVEVSGQHNALNATASVVCGIELGMTPESIKNSLKKYSGAKRRMEYVGKLTSGALVYDDYAHHPKEISETLSAFREMFPKKRLVCIFQPHTFSRTKKLFEQFTTSFDKADVVGIMNIFSSAREKDDETVSSIQLVSQIKLRKSSVFSLPEALDVVQYIDQNRFGEDTIVILMGAGDIYKLTETLTFEK
jgi:UDP-N-acetylmuramate--alanine ligase